MAGGLFALLDDVAALARIAAASVDDVGAAAARASAKAAGVVVDDTAEPSAVPPRFNQLNYTWLPGGKVTPAFVRELKAIVSGA